MEIDNSKTRYERSNTLQIQNNDKDQEIEKKEGEVRELREKSDSSREKLLDREIKEKDTKLEERIKKLGVDRTQVRELQKFYQQLIRVRVNDDQDEDEIDTVNDKIETIKDSLIDGGIDVVDTQKLCRKCESIAKLKVEQDKLYQKRFEAKQEVVLYNKSN